MESPKSRSSPLKKNRLPRPRKAPEGLGSGSAPSPLATKRSEEHTSELQSRLHLVCRLLLEKKKKILFCTDFNSVAVVRNFRVGGCSDNDESTRVVAIANTFPQNTPDESKLYSAFLQDIACI